MKEAIVLLSIVAISKAISGGHNTVIKRHQWQLSLRDQGNHFCGAVKIHEFWGLTSAFCLSQRDTRNLSVRGGSSNLVKNSTEDGFEVPVDSFILHPKFNIETLDSDIALIHFSRNISDDVIFKVTLPFCLNCDVNVSSPTTLTGWGASKPSGSSSEVLQMAQTSTIKRTVCQFAYPTNVITLNMFCAGYYQSDSVKINACEGDYGGPAIIYSRLEGIISWSKECENSNFPTVMTRVAPFVNWIKQHTGMETN